MSSRKRRPNWTEQECLHLARLMQERKDIVRGNCSTGVSIQDKRKAWEEITQGINTAFPEIQGTVPDCNKKWENLLAKSREEIKRQKRQADEGLSLDDFSTVTRIVISVMNLSDVLQQSCENSSMSDLMETKHTSCARDGKASMSEKSFTNKCPLTGHELPTYPHPLTSSGQEKMTTFTNIHKSLAVQFGTPNAAFCTSSGEQSCSTSLTSVHSTTLQERMDLEMSVLRRQEAVLKLQEEYYTLKIKLIKKQMEESLQKN